MKLYTKTHFHENFIHRFVCLSFYIFIGLITETLYAQTNIYYYYPDSPVSNLSQLKTEVEKTLAHLKQGIIFQPFSRLPDFEKQIKINHNAIVMSPDWLIADRKRFNILLTAFRNKQSTYKKLLITANSNNATRINLKNKTLATTPMGLNSNSVSELFETNENLQLLDGAIIEVSKDIDAIFAVSLKQVDYALVAKTSLEKIRKINPRIIDSLRIVAKTSPLALPSLLHTVGNISEKDLVEFVDFMRNLRANEDNAFKKLLLIDEWRLNE